MAEIQEQFVALLETLASPDNEIRNRGEEQYNSIPAEQRINLLLTSIKSSDQPHLRYYKLIQSLNFYSKVKESCKSL